MIWRGERPFVFVHVPKTGGTSVEQAFSLHLLGKSLGELDPCEAEDLYLPRRGSARHHGKYVDLEREVKFGAGEKPFVFGFVRNPWDLVISEIAYLQPRCPDIFPTDDWGENIRKIAGFSGEVWGHDFEPQVGYFTGRGGDFRADFVGRFENLERDFAEACERVGLPGIEIPHLLRSGRAEHYSTCYDDEAREIVAERFWADIEMFGYEFEEPGRRTVMPALDRPWLQARREAILASKPEPPRGGGAAPRPPQASEVRLAICFCIEGNHLEEQGLLLAHSLREFGGLDGETRIFAVQPRVGNEVSAEGRAELGDLGVTFVAEALNTRWPRLGFANKIYVLDYLERRLSGSVGTLLFLDTDILCCGALGALALSADHDVALKPVDTRNIGLPLTSGLDAYWQTIYSAVGAVPPGWGLAPTIGGGGLIHPYFNAGVIATRPGLGLFGHSVAALDSSAARFLFGATSGRERFHIEQCVLSATIASRVPRERIELLGTESNYPFGLHDQLGPGDRIDSLGGVRLLHYHRQLYDPGWVEKIEVPQRIQEWLIGLSGG